VATKVAAGIYAWGLTDTDDAIIELENARPVAVVFPDQGSSEIGTLWIPNTLAVIKNGPNPHNARKLFDRLLTSDVEQRLAAGPSAQIPFNPALKQRSRVLPADREVKLMQVDFQKAAEQWEQVAERLQKIFS
jgi:iron(III) transport system substrate-binding protein